jgi:hypothetical protein
MSDSGVASLDTWLRFVVSLIDTPAAWTISGQYPGALGLPEATIKARFERDGA